VCQDCIVSAKLVFSIGYIKMNILKIVCIFTAL